MEVEPGTIYARWTVVLLIQRSNPPSALCKCECSTTKPVRIEHLKSGASKSCGCSYHYQNGLVAEYPMEYRSWYQMCKRCNDPRDIGYNAYGGRGISVCERWLSFDNFIKDMGHRPDGMSLDRINNDDDYGKVNCKWSTASEQARNRRNSVYLTVDGETKLLIEWAEESEASYHLIRARLRSDWSERDAVFTPPGGRRGRT